MVCRAATHRQIDIDKKKRQAIEAAKAAELQCEREKLQRWQDGDAEGDESDCEQMVAEEVHFSSAPSVALSTILPFCCCCIPQCHEYVLDTVSGLVRLQHTLAALRCSTCPVPHDSVPVTMHSNP